MKISLDVKIPIEITQNGEKQESLVVFYRDYTLKEKEEIDTLTADFKKLFIRANKLEQKESILSKKFELLKKMQKFERAFEISEEMDQLTIDAEDLNIEIEKLRGDDFEETMAKKRFDMLIFGEDKDKLREYAERTSYKMILSAIDKEKGNIEKSLSIQD
ncbi:hypothetical protein [Sulfurospirillum sp. 1612]|uniref:hypothetical protein n=1 Tax=Sulfurospirillum sp. 1612 TaxID=3094835 RepID=UPI002F954BA8